MLRWIIELSLRLRFLVVVLAVLLIVVGISQLRSMPVNVYPEINPPLVEVQTEAIGLSAVEVESLITTPMEADLLNGVAWLQDIYSESVAGLSSILMVFEPGTDPIRARQMVQERLTQAHALPNVSKPPVMLQPLSSTGRVMIVGISSSDLSLIDLGVLARWTIQPRLLGVSGVANVAIWGQRERELHVQVDPVRLHEDNVTLSQVIETTGEALWVSPLSYLESSKPGTGGWIDTPNQRLGIRHLLPIASPEDLAQVAVADHPGLVLGDISDIVVDHQPLIGDSALESGQALLLVVEKFPGANILEVTRGVEEAMDALRPGLEGVEIDTMVFRPATYIEQAINNLSLSLLVGAILVLLVLFLLLGSWRTMLIALVTIPLSLIVATWVMYLRNAPFNMMVLIGLLVALGVVIDDAVGSVENIERRLHQRRQRGSNESLTSIILQASLEFRGAIVFGTLVLTLILLPVLLMDGITGAFLQPLVVTYGLAIAASLLVALLVTPGMSLLLFHNASGARSESSQVRGIQNLYASVLGSSLRAPATILIVAAILTVVGVALLPAMEQSLLPPLKQLDLQIRWEGAPGTSRTAMNRIAAQVSQELRTVNGVRDVGFHVGRAITGDQIVGINSAELWANIDPAADYEGTLTAIRDITDGYPGVFHQVQTYQPERIDEALVPSDKDLIVRVYGVDFPTLREKTTEVAQAISGVNGVVEASEQELVEEPQVEIEVDLMAAEKFGVKPGDVRRAASTLFSGIHVGSLFEEQKIFDVMVIGTPEIRDSLTDLRNLRIDATEGRQVMLSDVADVRIAGSPISIERHSVSRYMDVDVKISGSADAVTAAIKEKLHGITFPLEFRAEVLDPSVGAAAAQRRTLIVALAALIGIFLLLQAAVGGWRLAFFLLLGLVTAISGGVIVAFVIGGGLSIGVIFGFLAILGIAVRNGLVSVSRYRQLDAQQEGAPDLEAIQRGARERLGPILMTALATAGAVLPIIFFGAVPGQEVLWPMALVVLGGLVTTTFFNLLVVPTLYMRFRPEPETETISLSEEPVFGMA